MRHSGFHNAGDILFLKKTSENVCRMKNNMLIL